MMYICTAGSDILSALYSELTTQLDNTEVARGAVSEDRDGVS